MGPLWFCYLDNVGSRHQEDFVSSLICPKCKGEMRAYERNGVTIDQCEECRGIFLDRGELERLVDVESQYSQPAAPQGGTPPPPAQPGYPPQQYPPQQYPPPQQQQPDFWQGLFGGGHHGNRRHH